jgi:hypothetical protein
MTPVFKENGRGKITWDDGLVTGDFNRAAN